MVISYVICYNNNTIFKFTSNFAVLNGCAYLLINIFGIYILYFEYF